MRQKRTQRYTGKAMYIQKWQYCYSEGMEEIPNDAGSKALAVGLCGSRPLRGLVQSFYRGHVRLPENRYLTVIHNSSNITVEVESKVILWLGITTA